MGNTNCNALKSKSLTAEILRRHLSYDPDTGVLCWKEFRNNYVPAGTVAGSIKADGYRHIILNQCTMRAHRVAWCIFYGVHPSGLIDHINGDPLDNRIANLRICNSRQNSHNISARRSASGFKGVATTKRGNFVAQIKAEGVNRYLGVFSKAEDAARRYDAVASIAFGEFANLNFPKAAS